MNRNSLKFKNICITDSLYSLLIFMLISESKISETFFIFDLKIYVLQTAFIHFLFLCLFLKVKFLKLFLFLEIL